MLVILEQQLQTARDFVRVSADGAVSAASMASNVPLRTVDAKDKIYIILTSRVEEEELIRLKP